MHGIFAAVATPVHPDGRVNEGMFDALLDFLLGSGVDGVCLGGATSEYPHVDVAARRALLERAGRRVGADRLLLAGIGASTLGGTLALGEAAADAGCRALLLPMPFFFRYAQHDLQAYCAQVSRTLAAPCLLYDLPDFTNALEPETAISLMREEEFIVGIKDSSGCTSHLRAYAGARQGRAWTLLVGDDRLLADGVREGWNGGISGVAGFCPEVVAGLYRSAAAGRMEEARLWQERLDELISRISVFPAPWGIRLGLAARGFDTGPLPLPLSETRRAQIADFTRWFSEWQHNL